MNKTILGVVLACLIISAINIWKVDKIGGLRPHDDPQAVYPRSHMATVTIEWKSGGLPVTFTSTRQPDETAEQWRARVADECAKMKLAFPPDPQ